MAFEMKGSAKHVMSFPLLSFEWDWEVKTVLWKLIFDRLKLAG